MIYISAQPDNIYFHWQVELYLYQFSKHGIIDDCYALFGYTGEKPSDYIVNLSNKYKGIRWYKDERTPSQKVYVPSIRPHILKKFFRENSNIGETNVFYHDSDIFLVKLPNFKLLLNDDVTYVSDTISYIGYKYISDSFKNYKNKYNELPDDDIFYKMCKICNIDPQLVKNNNDNSGGAQYLLKGITDSFWEECENMCNNLYDFFIDYDKKYPVTNTIQRWTADMWAVLWCVLKNGKKVKCHKELDFSWATSNIEEYYSKNIFHLAGITDETANDKFYKGKYTNKNIFKEYIKDPTIYDHISKNNATYQYVEVIKEYVKKVYNNDINNNIDIINDTFLGNFILECIEDNSFSDIYLLDKYKKCCNRPIYRSYNDKFIIFWNSTSYTWILTSKIYENEIGEKCHGGFSYNVNEIPYSNEWSYKSNIRLITNKPFIGIYTHFNIGNIKEINSFINNLNETFMNNYNKLFFISIGSVKEHMVNTQYVFYHIEGNNEENIFSSLTNFTMLNLFNNKLEYIFNIDSNSWIPNCINDINICNDYVLISDYKNINKYKLFGSKESLFINSMKNMSSINTTDLCKYSNSSFTKYDNNFNVPIAEISKYNKEIKILIR